MNDGNRALRDLGAMARAGGANPPAVARHVEAAADELRKAWAEVGGQEGVDYAARFAADVSKRIRYFEGYLEAVRGSRSAKAQDRGGGKLHVSAQDALFLNPHSLMYDWLSGVDASARHLLQQALNRRHRQIVGHLGEAAALLIADPHLRAPLSMNEALASTLLFHLGMEGHIPRNADLDRFKGSAHFDLGTQRILRHWEIEARAPQT